MGLFEKLTGKFYVDGVEVGEMQTATIEVDAPEYETIKLPNLTDISLSGTYTGEISLTPKHLKIWKVVRDKFLKNRPSEKKSKQIRRMSYRKTKSQRRRA